jgi:tRNA (guanosine-2'-O-)-methyltransferase
MVGAELEGLSDESVAAADETLMIPMEGMARSLNVSVATAIVLFEAQRQRAKAGMYQSSRLDPAEEEKVLFEWAHPELARALREKNLPYPPLTEEGDPLLEPGALQD